MLFIIMGAFANFFLIINYDKGVAFVPRFIDVGIPFVNALIQIYITGLGELGYLEAWKDDNNTHTNTTIAFFAMFLGTFLVLIVFMNLIIAMMDNTFNNVQ